MSVAQLVRECSWRMETLETFGSEVRVRYEHRRNPLRQGTHMQLPLSMDCFCQNKYSKCIVTVASRVTSYQVHSDC